MKEQYNTAAQEITSSVNYDVSQAYNRYKQQQLALLQNQNIATGLQEQLTSQAASAYESQYAQSRAEGLDLMASLQEKYASQLAQAGEQLAEKADLYAALEQAAYEYGGVNMEDYYDTVQSDEAPYTKTYTLNPKGEDYLKRAFFTDLQEKTSFQQYLANMAENAETAEDRKKYQSMLDLYGADPYSARELIGGISRDVTKYTPEDAARNLQNRMSAIESGKSSLGSYDEFKQQLASVLTDTTLGHIDQVRVKVKESLSKYAKELGLSDEWVNDNLSNLMKSAGVDSLWFDSKKEYTNRMLKGRKDPRKLSDSKYTQANTIVSNLLQEIYKNAQ